MAWSEELFDSRLDRLCGSASFIWWLLGGHLLRVFSGGGVKRTTHRDPCRGWVNGAVPPLLPHRDNLFGGVGGDGHVARMAEERGVYRVLVGEP